MNDQIRMTPVGTREPSGFRVFRYTLYREGREVDHLFGRSGLASHQTLRGHKDKKSKPGCAEPLPEAVYHLGYPEYEPDYETWPEGLDDRWMALTPSRSTPLVGGRGAFGAHPDGAAPGSLGCAATYTQSDWEKMAEWRREGQLLFIVDHGLGLVPALPPVPPAAEYPTANIELDGKLVGTGLIIDGKVYPAATAVAAMLGLKIEGWDGKTKTVRFASAEK